jgi:hypothetical protein
MSADVQPATAWLDEFAGVAPRSIHPSQSVGIPFINNRGEVSQLVTGRRRTSLLRGRSEERAVLDALLAGARG